MTENLRKLILILFMMVGTQVAHAGVFGWSATVKAIEPGTLNYHHQTVTAPTHMQCETERLFAINNTFASYIVIDPGACVPNPVDVSRFVIPDTIRWLDPWPWPGPGPWCLSCPYLVDEFIDTIYPAEQAKLVRELMGKYKIDSYNKELQHLQQRYDLQSFEEEMFKLENAGTLEGLKQ